MAHAHRGHTVSAGYLTIAGCANTSLCQCVPLQVRAVREALALEVLPALTAVLGMQPLLSSTWGKDGTVAWWHMSEGELAADEDVLVVRALCFGQMGLF